MVQSRLSRIVLPALIVGSLCVLHSDCSISLVCLVLQMEKDVSVRQQAVDLLYAMCDRSNAEEIVQEMLNYLETADYSIREEMVSGGR